MHPDLDWSRGEMKASIPNARSTVNQLTTIGDPDIPLGLAPPHAFMDRRGRRKTQAYSLGGLLRLPENLVDLADEVEQLLALAWVLRLLRYSSFLGCVPQEVVELRVLLGVLGLEVVRPQNPQVVLHQVGPLLLDDEAPGLVVLCGLVGRLLPVGVLIALLDALDGFGLDARLCRVVDAARQVAVGMDNACGAKQTSDKLG